MSSAADLYEIYKRKYNNAKEQKAVSERKEAEYKEAQTQSEKDLKAVKQEKKNLEKRLEGVKKILSMLYGSGGLFTADVPGAIDDARRSASRAGTAYTGCIRCTGVNAADVGEAFNSATVSGNTYSASALSGFEAEKRRLEDSLDEIDRQIRDLDTRITQLRANIRQCDADQISLKSKMSTYSEMKKYYKKKMNEE